MTRWGSVDFKQMKAFQKKLEKLDKMRDEFCEAAAKELAARLLAKVIKRTPVGRAPKLDVPSTIKVKLASSNTVTQKAGNGHVSYQKKTMRTQSFLTAEGARHQMHWAGYSGGTLRRGWTGDKTVDGASYAQSLPIKKKGDSFVIDIINPVEYASYVEFGHRQTPGRYVPALGKKLKGGWVKGRFMLTKSEIELSADAPKILEKKLAKWLGDNLK